MLLQSDMHPVGEHGAAINKETYEYTVKQALSDAQAPMLLFFLISKEMQGIQKSNGSVHYEKTVWYSKLDQKKRLYLF